MDEPKFIMVDDPWFPQEAMTEELKEILYKWYEETVQALLPQPIIVDKFQIPQEPSNAYHS